MDEESNWFAVMTEPRGEKAANMGLKRRGFTTFYPFVRERLWRNQPRGLPRRRVEVERPYFNRYLFVDVPRHRSLWEVANAPGVLTVVCFAGQPLCIPLEVIGDLMVRGDAWMNSQTDPGLISFIDRAPDGPELPPSAVVKDGRRIILKRGQKVRLSETCAFAGLISQIAFDDGKRIRVWLEALGGLREVPIEPSMIAEIVS
ncbi:transcription termination/antitermination protein NusG [Xanthobacteraceae bacterium A53D]